MNLAHFIKLIRERKMSQRELASKVGISHSYISKLESNKEVTPSDEILENIAEVLEYDPDLLYLAAERLPQSMSKQVRQIENQIEFEDYLDNLRSYHHNAYFEIDAKPTLDTVGRSFYNNSSLISITFDLRSEKITTMSTKALELFKITTKKQEDLLMSDLLRFEGHQSDQLEDMIQKSAHQSVTTFQLNVEGWKKTSGKVYLYRHGGRQYITIIVLGMNTSLLPFKTDDVNTQFNEVYSNFPDPVYLINLNTDDSLGNYRFVNRAASSLLGYTYEEFLQMSPYDLDDNLSAQTIETNMKILLKDGFNVFKVIHISKDGNLIPFEIHASIISLGDDKGVFAMAIDRRAYYRDRIKKKKEGQMT